MNKLFNKFAEWASRMVSRAGFFSFCVLIILIWAPSFFVFGNIDTWQLIINTLTTIITFLLVALLQNTQQRFEDATNEKLNAIAKSLGDLMKQQGLDSEAKELYSVYGIEDEVEA
jgi:low affinity Fe/Cu permease